MSGITIPKKTQKKITLKQYSSYDLPYAHNALEPFIDAETMRLHHDVIYSKYVALLNEGYLKSGFTDSVQEVLTQAANLPTNLIEGASSFVNHSMLWHFFKPNDGKGVHLPFGESQALIERDFESVQHFLQIIEEDVINFVGCGWVWWVMEPDGSTSIISMANESNPYMLGTGAIPLWGVDVWEHAYLLKNKENKKAYFSNVLHVTNWLYVNNRIKMNQ